jgi:hypothetical protein
LEPVENEFSSALPNRTLAALVAPRSKISKGGQDRYLGEQCGMAYPHGRTSKLPIAIRMGTLDHSIGMGNNSESIGQATQEKQGGTQASK